MSARARSPWPHDQLPWTEMQQAASDTGGLPGLLFWLLRNKTGTWKGEDVEGGNQSLWSKLSSLQPVAALDNLPGRVRGKQGRRGKDLLPFGFGACCNAWVLRTDCQDPVSTCPAPCQSQPCACPSPEDSSVCIVSCNPHPSRRIKIASPAHHRLPSPPG